MAVMEAKTGKFGPDGRAKMPTLRKCIDKYLDDHPLLSQTTVRGYHTHQKNHLQSIIDLPIDKITLQMMQAAVNEDSTRLKPKTVHDAVSMCNTVLEYNGLPRLKPKELKPEAAVRPWLDSDDVVKLCGYLEQSGDEGALVTLLALHSLRRSELLALTWENIDLEEGEMGVIHVRGALVYSEDGMVERTRNKSRAGRRDVPIFSRHLKELLEAGKAGAEPGDHVVELAPNTVCRRIARACEMAGVPRVTTHGMRHSYASLCFYMGVSVKTVQETGGWDDPGTAQKIYAHVSARQNREVAAKLGGFLNK